jgi:uncharacterized membrane protein YgdD (TMEM256/DUF423 family)
MFRLQQSTALPLTAILGALAVGLGAFGAHGLQDLLVENGRLDTWATAAIYHLVHAGVLLVLVTWKSWKPVAWTLMAAGVVIFSGSLYLLSLTNIGWLGVITPVGGMCLIAGWIMIGIGWSKA